MITGLAYVETLENVDVAHPEAATQGWFRNDVQSNEGDAGLQTVLGLDPQHHQS